MTRDRQVRGNEDPAKGTVEARPWLEEGYSLRYPWLYARAVSAIAQEARERKRPPKKGEQAFLVTDPSGRFQQDLFRLATSYPFLKKAWDITSLKGNIPGSDKGTFYGHFQIPDFGDRLLRKLKGVLRSENFFPHTLRRTEIPKSNGSTRTLHIPTVLDRMVERAVLLALTPLYEQRFEGFSYGFRQGSRLVHPMRDLEGLMRETGYRTLVKCDLQNAFDNVPHNRLKDILGIWVNSPELKNLIGRFIDRPKWRNREGKEHVGLPQGGPLSPLLFNVYLDHMLDKRLVRKHPDIIMLRWADDLLLVCPDKGTAEKHLKTVEDLLLPAGMRLSGDKTAIGDLSKNETIEYLGFNVRWKNGLSLGTTTDAWDRLTGQLLFDTRLMESNTSFSGLKTYLRKQTLHIVEAWLSAYAGGIEPDHWKGTRKAIKRIIFLLRKCTQDPIRKKAMPDGLNNNELNNLYERQYRHWQEGFHPDPIHSSLRRDAPALPPLRHIAPDIVADGADLVPAPLAIVASAPRSGPETIDFRVSILPSASAEPLARPDELEHLED